MPGYFLLLLFLFPFLLSHSPTHAQTPPNTIKFQSFTPPPTRTPSPTPYRSPTPQPVLNPPNLPPDNNPPIPQDPGLPAPDPQSSNVIHDLVNQIKRHCGGKIFKSTNISCVFKMSFPNNIDKDVKDELYYSAYGNDWLQCVGFARASAARFTGQKWPWIPGNAVAYASTATPPGYKFIRKGGTNRLQPHDIVIWDYKDGVGHIAYVTKVYDSVNYQVAEANYGCGSGCVRVYNKVTTDPTLIGWIRKR